MTSIAREREAYRRFVVSCACGVVLVSLAVIFIGWVADVPAVRSLVPGAVGMKFPTALGLLAGAGSLLLAALAPTRPRKLLQLTFAVVPGLIGAAVLAEYLFGVNARIDQWPFADVAGRAAHIAFPGRLAPTTATSFLLLTGALLMIDVGRGWRWRPSEVLSLPFAAISLTSLIGYAYSIPQFFGPASAAKMAVNTGACFIALAAGIVLVRPRGRILELARTTDPGGVMVRRIVPLCLVLPLVLGWLQLRAVHGGLFSEKVAVWWFAVVTAIILTGMMWWCAGTLSRADRRRRRLEDQLMELATRDTLTGLLNRHGFEESFDLQLARAARYSASMSLLAIDLDRLKPINDELGHAIGDAVLREAGAAIRSRVRDSDLAGRLGGDEFAVLLAEADTAAAHAVAADLLARIAAIDVATLDTVARTTASIGIVTVGGEGSISRDALFARADSAMYEAKRAGGNGIVAARALDSAQRTTPLRA